MTKFKKLRKKDDKMLKYWANDEPYDTLDNSKTLKKLYLKHKKMMNKIKKVKY
jgi:hypothetical protein